MPLAGVLDFLAAGVEFGLTWSAITLFYQLILADRLLR
jgi:hypothetical protein